MVVDVVVVDVVVGGAVVGGVEVGGEVAADDDMGAVVGGDVTVVGFTCCGGVGDVVEWGLAVGRVVVGAGVVTSVFAVGAVDFGTAPDDAPACCVVVVEFVVRVRVAGGEFAPDAVQAATSRPPASRISSVLIVSLIRTLLSVPDQTRSGEDVPLGRDYCPSLPIVHSNHGKTRRRIADRHRGGWADPRWTWPETGDDSFPVTPRSPDRSAGRRRLAITASRLSRPAPSPMMTSAMAASATLNS